jgi:hypothetical protein
MVVLGAGTGLFYSSATTAAISSLDESRSGLASRDPLHAPGRGRVGGARHRDDDVTAGDFASGVQDALRVSAVLAAVGLAVVLLLVHPARQATAVR